MALAWDQTDISVEMHGSKESNLQLILQQTFLLPMKLAPG